MHILLALAAPASACPTIATGTPAGLAFDVAQVAITRQGTRTTFSVSINPFGDAQEFALVLPVPEVLERDQVATLDGTIFQRLDGYTAPRHVSNAGCPSDSAYAYAADGGTSDSGQDEGAGGVDVEAEYLVGEYQVTILSATESGALAQWLDDNAYYLPEGSEPMLAEYIEGGSYFLAAKVAEEAALANGEPLSPLQVTYDNPVFAIPIRLATLNSPGEQDMVIYAINELDGQDSGRVGIASYPEFTIPDVCVWGDPSAGDEFNEFYEEHFTKSWTAVGDAGWAVEYAGTWWDCSPCSNVSITEEDLLALGFQGETYNHHLTRIRMRYTPEQADVDLALYGSGIYEPQVTSYADATERNFTCIESFCDGSATPGNEAPDDDGEAGDLLFGGDCGCSAPTAPGSAAPLAILGLALARRRRE